MKNRKQSSNLLGNNRQFSSIKRLNTIKECQESSDIIKKIEAMDFSVEKSFDTPYISLSKTKDKFINNLNKSISVPNLLVENFEAVNSDNKSLKDYELNDSNYLEIISKFLNNKDSKDQVKNNIQNKLFLKEKINKICVLLQKYNLNKSYLDKMNNFLSQIDDLNQNLFQSFDSILDIVSGLLSRIQEESQIKNDLTNKLNNLTINKEIYEKQISDFKNDIIDKEKQIEKLMNKSTIECHISKKENQKINLFDIKNIKKENQFLFEKILTYKAEIKQILTAFSNLYENHKICLKEIDKFKANYTKNLCEENVNNFEINRKLMHKAIKSSISNSNTNILNGNNMETNINSSIKELSNNLIKLLLNINRMLFKCDFNLVKISKNCAKTSLNDINEINENIDVSFLLDKMNYKLFSKYISCNMDIINNKIINLPNYFSLNNNKSIKETKNSFLPSKNVSEYLKNNISISNISKNNKSIRIFSPENKNSSKKSKIYINLKKAKNNQRHKKFMRNSTSNSGLSYMNFYSNMDFDSIPTLHKNNSNKKTNAIINRTMNLEQPISKNINGEKMY